MFSVFRSVALAILMTGLVAFAVAGAVSAQTAVQFRVAQSNVTEKEAFDAAKELGTIEAWEAFLNNFPKGFRADLARAYVRRLGAAEKKPDPAPAQPPAAAPQAPRQAATPPPPPPAPPLSTVNMGPAGSSWFNGTIELDEGRTRAQAAIVQANGVRLSAYCSAQRTVPLVISGEPHGVYPDFDRRVEQGLTAAGGNPNSTNNASIPVSFVGGQQYFVRASLQGLTGEILLGNTDAGFSAGSPILESIMAGSSMTVSAPPFVATFQLRGSRGAICSLLRSCGLASSQPGCAAPAPRPLVNTPAVAPRPRPKTVNCTLGRVFSSRLGKCVCPRNQPHFYGGRCRPVRDCPGDSVLNSRGQCVKENEPPQRQNTFVPDCPGGQQRNAQGQCVRAFNPQNEAIKLQCNLHTIACAAGNQSSCKKAASLCDRG